MKSFYEVVIVGGGLAGTATALALVQAGLKNVLIVEAGCYQSDKPGETLAPEAGSLLNRLGLSDDLLNQRYLRSPGHYSEWGSQTAGATDFIAHPFGEGWHIDRRDFEQHLAYQAGLAGVEILTGTRFIKRLSCSSSPAHRLLLKNTSGKLLTISCRFAVDATGLRGALATSFGSRPHYHAKQLFLYGFFTLPTAMKPDPRTTIEAVENGWWYKARLPDNRMIISLATSPRYYKAQQLHDWSQWLNELAATNLVSQSMDQVAFSPQSFSVASGPTYLRSIDDDNAIADSWTAVGDACMAVDPIFGRGMINALTHGADAGEAIARCIDGDATPLCNLHFNNEQQFATYQRHRSLCYQWEQRWPHSSFWTDRQRPADNPIVG
ncbi:MAG: NAD(P)/FAD-dependent oxidoreductase [Pseudomonadota bacterium]